MPLIKTPPKLHSCGAKTEADRAMVKRYGSDPRLWPSGVWWQCEECGWRWKIRFDPFVQVYWVIETRLGHWWRNWRSK